MARRPKITRSKPELNITAMLDVVLNLIMFFILITNYSTADLPKEVVSPHPDGSKANSKADLSSKLVVNIVPVPGGTGEAGGLLFAGKPYTLEQMGLITAQLAKEVAINKDITISLRADKTIRYDQVHPVMTAIAESGVKTVYIVAEVDKH
ncbi:MAG: biopolymer transporter ExbD [Planctomycetes bacterium]|nr:biopolymer transporter ExbD [Planctomycetota bacterium]